MLFARMYQSRQLRVATGNPTPHFVLIGPGSAFSITYVDNRLPFPLGNQAERRLRRLQSFPASPVAIE